MSTKEKAQLEVETVQAPLLSQVKPTESRKQSDPMIAFWTYWPLLIHFVSVLSFGFTMIFVVNGAKFNIVSRIESVQETDGSELPLPFSLLQSDMTTIISAVVVVIRFMSGAWVTLAIWRCAFIVLEKSGATLGQLDTLLSLQIPVKLRSGGRIDWECVLVALVLLLLLPSQAIAPLVTGSITWVPSVEYIPGIKPLDGISESRQQGWWQNFRFSPDFRFETVLRAAAVGGRAWVDSAQGNVSGVDGWNARRMVTSAGNLQTDTELASITLPYFKIDQFRWVQQGESFNTALLNEVVDTTYLLVSNTFNPILRYMKGSIALVPNTSWQSSNPTANITEYPFPAPTLVTQQEYLVLVQTDYNLTDPCPTVSPSFGNLPPGGVLFHWNSPNVGVCLLLGMATVTAGAGVYDSTRIIAPLIVAGDTQTVTPVPDPMTETAIWMMPEVLGNMINLNISLPATYDNVDVYVPDVLNRAFNGAWSALNSLNDTYDPTYPATPVSLPHQVSEASVHVDRVYAWMGVNLLITISGFVLWLAQRKCQRPAVNSGVMAALLMDTRDILLDVDDLRDLVKLTHQHSKEVGPLRLRRTEGGYFALARETHSRSIGTEGRAPSP